MTMTTVGYGDITAQS